MTQSVCRFEEAHISPSDRHSARQITGIRRRERRSHGRPRNVTSGRTALETEATPLGFAGLGLSRRLLAALERVGFQEPTDIQRELIPPALEGRDCLGQARTGTGKTAAFTLPMLQCVRPRHGIQALVLVPTRELAAQVGEHVHLLSPETPPRTLVVYGGTGIGANLRELKRGVDIVVGTPGRILDLIQRGALDLRGVRFAVLDEVDRMLDIGFRDDIRRIMTNVARDRQTIFVSATMTEEIRRLAYGLMHDPAEINVSADCLTVDQVRQDYMTVEARDKTGTLRDVPQADRAQLGHRLHAYETRRDQGRATTHAGKRGLCRNSRRPRPGTPHARCSTICAPDGLKVLVATDLASRGLDVTGVSHIVNYDIPSDPAVYVHRIGRTARMGNSGHALTFVTPEQGRELTDIEMLIDRQLNCVETPASARASTESARESAEASSSDRRLQAPRRTRRAVKCWPPARQAVARAGLSAAVSSAPRRRR